ncbi:hypothetical protein HYS94_05165 [Candidatus Daviesbacteria bacterium]|nr:hypothetical protein [Candidatus Daviesbacteria bacterium]
MFYVLLFDFKDNIFSQLFPKPISEAARRIIPPWWRRPPPSPKPSPTPAPTATPTPTPTPVSGQFPLVIGVDSSNLDWWNSKAQSSDIVIGVSYTLSSVSSAKGGRVMLISPTNPSSDMDTAKSKGWSYVTANIEDPNIDLVIGGGVDRDGNTVIGIKEQYQMAKDRGLTFVNGPTGIQLEDEWDYTYQGQDHALVRNADIIAYQAQHFQDNSTELGTSDSSKYASTFASKVKDLISKIKPYIGQQKVWVQLSANPPANRCTTADQVIKYIDSIVSGSQPYADTIVIFVSSQYDSGVDRKGDGNCVSKGQPTRVDVMKQVVDHYR